MTIKELEKEVRKIIKEGENRLSCPIAQRTIDKWLEEEGKPADFDGDPDGQEEYLDTIRSRVIEHVEDVSPYLTAGRNKKPSNLKRGPYNKTFERRLHLVEFIIYHQVREKPSWRIDWKRITDEWNEAHLFDRFNSESLKREYYRAIQEETLIIQLLISLHPGRSTEDKEAVKRDLLILSNYLMQCDNDLASHGRTAVLYGLYKSNVLVDYKGWPNYFERD